MNRLTPLALIRPFAFLMLLGFYPFASTTAQTSTPDSKLSGSLAKCVDDERPRLARYVIHSVADEHVHFEGPYLLSKPEADALLPLLQKRAVETSGATAKASFASVDKPESCSFLYRPKNSKKLSMAQGGAEYLAKRQGQMLRGNDSTLLTDMVCMKPDEPGMPKSKSPNGQAYGFTAAEACEVAKRCYVDGGSLLAPMPPVESECLCTTSVAGLQYCKSRPKRGDDTAFGIRG